MSRISKYARLRPSPAAVIAVIALVFAVSGVAVALPGKNSVVSKDIKKNAVTAAKIKNGAVTEPKLGDGAVSTSKIGADAVTGAKVNEGTLGKVPSATSADTAAKATSAEKATTADNALELQGRSLGEVRALAIGTSKTETEDLDSSAFEAVMGTTINIPTGGANVVVTAVAELDNESGGQAGAACRLKFNGSVVGSTTNITMTDGFNTSISATAFDDAGAGIRQAFLECQGSIADGEIQFLSGDLNIQAFPTGA